jgi:hypothetical protein
MPVDCLFDSLPSHGAGRCLLISAMLAVSACSSVQVRYPDGSIEYKSKDEFAHYMEAVFRHHNRVVNELIIATALMHETELEAASPLVRAEEAAAQSCRPLNDAVSATIEGRELGFFEKLQLPEAVPACDEATRRLEALLPPPV